jgi:hypothetical protein
MTCEFGTKIYSTRAFVWYLIILETHDTQAVICPKVNSRDPTDTPLNPKDKSITCHVENLARPS